MKVKYNADFVTTDWSNRTSYIPTQDKKKQHELFYNCVAIVSFLKSIHVVDNADISLMMYRKPHTCNNADVMMTKEN